jgi:hypothetical protein
MAKPPHSRRLLLFLGGAMLYQSVPAGLRSLATTEPGSTVVVRSLLSEWTRAYLGALCVRTSDRLWFHGADRQGVQVETESGVRFLVPWEHAAAVQVERLEGVGARAGEDQRMDMRAEVWRG